MLKKLLIVVAFSSASLFMSNVGNAQPKVVAEMFRGMSCGNCKQPDDQFETFVNGLSAGDVVIIYYHNGIPTTHDAFYQANTSEVNARNQYYGVSADPIGFIDGVNAGATFSGWQSYTNQAIATSPLTATITPTVSLNGQQLSVQLVINGSAQGQVVPYIALLEDSIVYHNTDVYGNPPNDTWNNVFRATVTPASGADPFILTGTGSKTVNYSLDLTGKSWNIAHLKIVAFIQAATAGTQNSHIMYGAAVAPVAASAVYSKGGVLATGLGVISPNPFHGEVSIPFQLQKSSHVKLVVTDLLGREMTSLLDRTVGEGSHEVTFAPRLSGQTGVYFVHFVVDGVPAQVAKIISQP